jgi:hypothetical protein
MVQKPIAISVIAPATVAGILMLAILVMISSTNQALSITPPTQAGKEQEATAASKVIAANCVNPNPQFCPHAEKPVKGTSPPKPITIPAPEKPRTKPTTLSLGANPNRGIIVPGKTRSTFPVSLSGRLISGGSGVAGATITFTGNIGTIPHHGSATTDSGGHYSFSVRLSPGTHTIEVHYAGDSDHESSSARTVIPVRS